MESRTCTKCGETKPLDAYYFEKGKPRASCKECHKASIYAKREADPDAAREYLREWREKNPGKQAGYERQRRARDGEKINERRRELRRENPRYLETQRAWYDDNREHVRERNKVWYFANHEKMKQWKRDYYRSNPELHKEWDAKKDPEKVRAYMKAYYAAHPEVFDKHRQLRRARLAGVDSEPWTRKGVYERDGGICQMCAKDLEFGKGCFQIDHIIPISKSGPDTWENVRLTCPTCNRRKWASLESEDPKLAA